jgi:hypothetical protein
VIFRRRKSSDEPTPEELASADELDDDELDDDEGDDEEFDVYGVGGGERDEREEKVQPEREDPTPSFARTFTTDAERERLESSRPRGPWDRSESDVDAADDEHIDLGGLVIRGYEGIELRLHVEDQQGSVAAALLLTPESALELRAFAAPRSGGIWDEVRADMVEEAERRGGTCRELDGEFGTELYMTVPVQTPDGQRGTQNSRVVGVDGPRWMLRGTFIGGSGIEADPDGLLETAFREVIVVRGSEPMAPRDAIAMHMPEEVRAQMQAAADGAAGSDDGPGFGEIDGDEHPA